MQKAIGIDLGTTNTVVAVLLDGRPQVLEDDKGYRVLPSVVTIDEFGTEVVGHAARNRILTDPDRTLYAIKRLMGRRYDTEQVAEARKRVGYDIEQGPDGSCLVIAAGKSLTAVEVSAMILRTAREMAERALGAEVDDAVITVPAYFNHQQRTATYEAAQLAGLRCERLINEPTAAALAYGFRRDLDRTLVVYDLGGGTFDVSVLHLAGGVYEILSTRGDTFLGGEDFDYRLVDYLADHFQADTGFDLRQERMALQRIKDAAERAKCELSFTDRTTVLVPRLTPDNNLELAVTRLTLESLVEDLVERSLEVTRKAISDAGLQLSDIDDVIMVGGQTRMPRVREAISGLFGKEPSRGVHPEEVVAIGAAVHAASITETDDAPHHVLIDVTPFDLGIDVAGGLFQTVVARNTHVPTSDTRTFATTRDDQDSVRITVRQGDSRFADENEFLGEFTMQGLTPAPRMETKVEVTFRIDSNGMLHVSSVEPGTGEARRITVRNYAEVADAKGGVSAQIESDGKGSVSADTPGGSDNAPVAVHGAGPGKAAKTGFLSGLLGRRKQKPAAATPAAQPAAAPPTAQPAAAATSAATAAGLSAEEAALPAPTEPDGVPVADTTEGLINLPSVAPLDQIDDAELDDLEGELIEPEVLDDAAAEPLEDPASIGMAGSALDAWDAPGDGFAMPEYDDDDDDDHVPVGLAGGGYDQAASQDEVFALPEDTGDLGSLPAETEEDLLGISDDAFADLGDDAFADLGEGVFDDLGDETFGELGGPDPTPAPPAPAAVTPPQPAAALDDDAFADLGDDAFADLGGDLFALSDDSDESIEGAHAEPALPPPSEPGTDRVPVVSPESTEPDTGDLFDFATGQPLPDSDRAAPALFDDAFSDDIFTDDVFTDDVFTDDALPDALPDANAIEGNHAEPLFLPPPDLDLTQPNDTIGEDLFGLPGAEDGLDEPDSSDRLFSLPAGLTQRPAPRQHDDEQTEIFARSPGPSPRPGKSRRRRRKPARLKLAYRHVDAMVTEYRENLRRGGCFVKTTKPLPVGRECVIEVRAPGMDEPLSLAGVVTWSSVGLSTLPAGQDPGMGIEYRLDEPRRAEIERVLAGLGV